MGGAGHFDERLANVIVRLIELCFVYVTLSEYHELWVHTQENMDHDKFFRLIFSIYKIFTVSSYYMIYTLDKIHALQMLSEPGLQRPVEIIKTCCVTSASFHSLPAYQQSKAADNMHLFLQQNMIVNNVLGGLAYLCVIPGLTVQVYQATSNPPRTVFAGICLLEDIAHIPHLTRYWDKVIELVGDYMARFFCIPLPLIYGPEGAEEGGIDEAVAGRVARAAAVVTNERNARAAARVARARAEAWARAEARAEREAAEREAAEREAAEREAAEREAEAESKRNNYDSAVGGMQRRKNTLHYKIKKRQHKRRVTRKINNYKPIIRRYSNKKKSFFIRTNIIKNNNRLKTKKNRKIMNK
jgi:hypothetical protein